MVFNNTHQSRLQKLTEWECERSGSVGERPSAFDMIAIKQSANKTTGSQYVTHHCCCSLLIYLSQLVQCFRCTVPLQTNQLGMGTVKERAGGGLQACDCQEV